MVSLHQNDEGFQLSLFTLLLLFLSASSLNVSSFSFLQVLSDTLFLCPNSLFEGNKSETLFCK